MSAVFLKILNMSITASWLILAVALARALLKKAPKWIVCLLWALVAIRLVCPFIIESAFSLISSRETIPADLVLSPFPAAHSGIATVTNTVDPIVADSVMPAPVVSGNPLQVALPLVAGIWVAGVVALLLYALISYVRLKRTVSAVIPFGERIKMCDEIHAPFILGVFKPMIYVPSSLTGETLDCVIRHERAHIRRRDHWWKPLGFLLLVIYWFNPLCWVAYILLCRDIEMACDEKVIREMDKESMVRYSQALLDCSLPQKRITACPLAFGETGIKERVKGVLNYKKPTFWIIALPVRPPSRSRSLTSSIYQSQK
jgi:beta-lactamase regulating signal transducer with metallopeptidase domain